METPRVHHPWSLTSSSLASPRSVLQSERGMSPLPPDSQMVQDIRAQLLKFWERALPSGVGYGGIISCRVCVCVSRFLNFKPVKRNAEVNIKR